MFHFFGVIATFGYPKLAWLVSAKLVSVKGADSLSRNLVLDVLGPVIIGVKHLLVTHLRRGALPVNNPPSQLPCRQ